MKTLVSLPAVALAFALSTTALSAQRPTGATEEKVETAARPTGGQVTVSNQNWLDARLYLDDNGQLLPLGFVFSQQTAQFKLPARAVTTSGPLRIVARPIGSRQSYVSQNLVVNHGDELLVILQNQLGLSSTALLPAIER